MKCRRCGLPSIGLAEPHEDHCRCCPCCLDDDGTHEPGCPYDPRGDEDDAWDAS